MEIKNKKIKTAGKTADTMDKGVKIDICQMCGKNKEFEADNNICDKCIKGQEKALFGKKRKASFPVVMKSKDGGVEIIYKDRVEIYKIQATDTFSEEDENKVNSAENEVEMALGSGFKRVHDSDNDKHWSVWGAEKGGKQ